MNESLTTNATQQSANQLNPIIIKNHHHNNNNESKNTFQTEDGIDLNKLMQASVKIQRSWRRYIDLQVFKYYRDLIVFHNEGDPALIMKYINPIEAKLIDAASGVFIKFRLAGHQFPPTIYYKIFTHRPIQDICANAPRDYTKISYKKLPAKLKNNRLVQNMPPPETFEGWYKRIENNGWRPVSTKHLMQMNLDFYFGEEFKSQRPVEFSHIKLNRRQEIEIKRKRTKIEWMKKMYKTGMLKSNDENPETQKLIEEAAKSLIETIDHKNATEQQKKSNEMHMKNDLNMLSVEEWEVDELLEWTNGLNFDEYYLNWKTIGTSKISDAVANERNKMKVEFGFGGSSSSTSALLMKDRQRHQVNSHPPMMHLERVDTFDLDDDLEIIQSIGPTAKTKQLNINNKSINNANKTKLAKIKSTLSPLEASTHRM